MRNGAINLDAFRQGMVRYQGRLQWVRQMWVPALLQVVKQEEVELCIQSDDIMRVSVSCVVKLEFPTTMARQLRPTGPFRAVNQLKGIPSSKRVWLDPNTWETNARKLGFGDCKSCGSSMPPNRQVAIGIPGWIVQITVGTCCAYLPQAVDPFPLQVFLPTEPPFPTVSPFLSEELGASPVRPLYPVLHLPFFLQLTVVIMSMDVSPPSTLHWGIAA